MTERVIYLFGAWRKIVRLRIGNEIKEGFWVTIAGQKRFIPLDKIFKLSYPRDFKLLESRVEFWSEKLTRANLNHVVHETILGKEIPCIPAFRLLRSMYPPYVVRKADRILWWFWSEKIDLSAARALANQQIKLDPLTHSYLCDLWALTQAVYRKLYPNTNKITLYRAINAESSLRVMRNLMRGVGLKTYNLTVFTESRDLARIHAIAGADRATIERSGAGLVVKKEVPISNIFFSWRIAGKGTGQELLVKQQVVKPRDIVIPRFVELYPKGVAEVETDYGVLNLTFLARTETLAGYNTKVLRQKALKKISRNELTWESVLRYTDYIALYSDDSVFLLPEKYFRLLLQQKKMYGGVIPRRIDPLKFDVFHYFIPLEDIAPLVRTRELGSPFLRNIEHCYLCLPDPDVFLLEVSPKRTVEVIKQYSRVRRRRRIYPRT